MAGPRDLGYGGFVGPTPGLSGDLLAVSGEDSGPSFMGERRRGKYPWEREPEPEPEPELESTPGPSVSSMRLPVDPRVVKEIQASGRMSREQGAGFMGSAGGPGVYQKLARLSREDKLVYTAVTGGHTTLEELEVATGLDESRVKAGLTTLQKVGLIAEV